MTFQYNSADSSLFLLLDWFLEYSRSYDVYLCDTQISYMDNYIPMHFRNHREQRRNFLSISWTSANACSNHAADDIVEFSKQLVVVCD